MAELKLVGITKSFTEGASRRDVLQDVSITLDATGFNAILGKSGSGKTTLLNLISGIDRADRGDVILDGLNLTALDEQERTLFRRKRIGFIFQFFNLIPTLTVWENILLPLELNGQMSQKDLDRAAGLLAEVGLADRRDTYPDRLSGGEQQRVAIARAVVHQPVLVLADEPTGNLDEETGRSVLALLNRLTRQAGRGLLLVTHSQDAAAYANQVYVLREGKLLLAGGNGRSPEPEPRRIISGKE